MFVNIRQRMADNIISTKPLKTRLVEYHFNACITRPRDKCHKHILGISILRHNQPHVQSMHNHTHT